MKYFFYIFTNFISRMDKTTNKYMLIEKIVPKIKLKYINIDLINKNAKYLANIYIKIRKLWDNLKDFSHILLSNNTDEYYQIIKITTNSIIGNYQIVQDELMKSKEIIKLTYGNITFYYINLSSYHKDKAQINFLFRLIITFAQYYNILDTNSNSSNPIIVIWLPINKSRDFNHDVVNASSLEASTQNFNAFTASGVTFGHSPRYTIISRYEEAAKLLLHELIHNFYVDGNICHHTLYGVITRYKKTKGNNYDYEYSMYESYTELLSSYYNIIFYNINLPNYLNNIQNKIKSQIILELLYSYNTIANLIKINGYNSYDEFLLKEDFLGDICVYEYYYLKALMYNKFPLIIFDSHSDSNTCDKFVQLYEDLLKMKRKDKLLREICNNYVKQSNFSYIFIK